MKKKLVIFLHQNFFTKNDWKIYQIEKYKEVADVYIFEFGKIINSGFEEIFKNRKKNHLIKKVINLNSWKLMLQKLLDQNYKKKLILNTIKPKKKISYEILKELSNLDIPIVDLENHHLPFSENLKKNFTDFLTKIQNLKYIKFLLFSKFYSYLFRKIKFKNYFILINGIKRKNFKNKNIIHGLVREYDLAVNEKVKSTKEKFILFLENESLNWPGDAKFFPGISSIENNFYEKLRNFFNYIEEKFKCKIIISAHPKSAHTTRPDYYGKRLVVKGKTNQLIKNAKFILAQPSMATSYIVYHRKPSILIFSKGNLASNFYMNNIRNIKKFIGINAINFEDSKQIKKIRKLIKLDKKKLVNYENSFLCPKNIRESNFSKINKLFL